MPNEALCEPFRSSPVERALNGSFNRECHARTVGGAPMKCCGDSEQGAINSATGGAQQRHRGERRGSDVRSQRRRKPCVICGEPEKASSGSDRG